MKYLLVIREGIDDWWLAMVIEAVSDFMSYNHSYSSEV